jgi:hypothetical protein
MLLPELKKSPINERKFMIPSTKEEWNLLKETLILCKVEDSPETWTFILSQLQGIKMPDLDYDIETLIAYYKRWKIAKVLQDEKAVYIEELQVKLKEKMESFALANPGVADEGTSPSTGSDILPIGTQHPEGELPGVPETQT